MKCLITFVKRLRRDKICSMSRKLDDVSTIPGLGTMSLILKQIPTVQTRLGFCCNQSEVLNITKSQISESK